MRTGEVFAYYEAETGYLYDVETGLAVALLNRENNTISPVEEEAENQD